MPTDPLATPPLPPVERLNRSILLVAALLVLVTLLAVAFLVSPRATSRPAQQHQPPLTAGAPGFLSHPPGNLPPSPRPPLTDQDYLRSLLERAAPAEPQPTGALAPPPGLASTAPPPPLPPAAPSAPPPPPRDLRREGFLRALRAPLAEPLPPPALPDRGAAPDPGASQLRAEGSPPAGADALDAKRGEPNPFDWRDFPPPPAGTQAAPPQPSPPPTPLPPAAARALGPRPPRATHDGLASNRETGALKVVFHPAASSTTLAAGTLIPALLETEVNSDLPGPLLAQVSRDVYDFHQRSIVVPRGSRLLGRYENQVAVGQRRLLVAWTRLTFPDGSGFDLPGLPGTDPSGAAGLSARVENHLLRLFGDALLLSLLSAAAELSQPQTRSLALAPSAGSVASAAVGQELANVGLQLLRRDLSIQPTLRLSAGTPFVVFVNGDLPLAPPLRGQRP
jgi:type IV secretory pathway VirB10-like protein